MCPIPARQLDIYHGADMLTNGHVDAGKATGGGMGDLSASVGVLHGSLMIAQPA